MALAVTTVCSEPKDGLAPGCDHRSISPLLFNQGPSWHLAVLVSRLSFKLNCHTFSQDPMSLAWSLLWIEVSESVVTVM